MATLAADLPHLRESDPNITAGDRLGMTLFVAIVAHAIVILGVVFVPHDRADFLLNTLDIVLVQQRSETAPKEAHYLSQANHEGSGEQEEKARPATPLQAPLTGLEPAVVASAPPSEPIEPVPLSKPKLAQSPIEQEVRRSVVALKNVQSTQVQTPADAIPQPKQKPSIAAVLPDWSQTEVSPTETVKASELISRSLAMASLNAEIDQRLEAYANRPRRKWISAKTREYRYASYMEAWRIKVERIGNLNYPDEARRIRLSGNLLLEVALNSNGSLSDIILRRSSGHRVLDDAAIRIVKLAAPFAPFPRDILEETDILHIERTWRFLNTNHFSSR